MMLNPTVVVVASCNSSGGGSVCRITVCAHLRSAFAAARLAKKARRAPYIARWEDHSLDPGHPQRELPNDAAVWAGRIKR